MRRATVRPRPQARHDRSACRSRRHRAVRRSRRCSQPDTRARRRLHVARSAAVRLTSPGHADAAAYAPRHQPEAGRDRVRRREHSSRARRAGRGVRLLRRLSDHSVHVHPARPRARAAAARWRGGAGGGRDRVDRHVPGRVDGGAARDDGDERAGDLAHERDDRARDHGRGAARDRGRAARGPGHGRRDDERQRYAEPLREGRGRAPR